jgi:hypothetical protein
MQLELINIDSYKNKKRKKVKLKDIIRSIYKAKQLDEEYKAILKNR